jgi:hypothetical protein
MCVRLRIINRPAQCRAVEKTSRPSKCLSLKQIVATQGSPRLAIGKFDHHELMARAIHALEAAKQLPTGSARSHAMKLAGKLRLAADSTLLASHKTN